MRPHPELQLTGDHPERQPRAGADEAAPRPPSRPPCRPAPSALPRATRGRPRVAEEGEGERVGGGDGAVRQDPVTRRHVPVGVAVDEDARREGRHGEQRDRRRARDGEVDRRPLPGRFGEARVEWLGVGDRLRSPRTRALQGPGSRPASSPMDADGRAPLLIADAAPAYRAGASRRAEPRRAARPRRGRARGPEARQAHDATPRAAGRAGAVVGRTSACAGDDDPRGRRRPSSAPAGRASRGAGGRAVARAL